MACCFECGLNALHMCPVRGNKRVFDVECNDYRPVKRRTVDNPMWVDPMWLQSGFETPHIQRPAANAVSSAMFERIREAFCAEARQPLREWRWQ